MSAFPPWLFDWIADSVSSVDEAARLVAEWRDALEGEAPVSPGARRARRDAQLQRRADAAYAQVPTGLEPRCPACDGTDLRRPRRVWVCNACDGGRR